MIGQLTGSIAHDFSDLLSIIIGNLDVLQDDSTVVKDPAMTATLVDEALQKPFRRAELLAIVDGPIGKT